MRRNSRARSGLTIIEVLLILVVLVFLWAILIPAVYTPRAASRQMQCANNIKQISLSGLSYAVANDEILPTSRVEVGGDEYSWVVSLFPYLEMNIVYERLEKGEQKPVPVEGRPRGFGR